MAKVKPVENRNTDETDLIARTKKYAFLKSQLDYLETVSYTHLTLPTILRV